MLKASAALLATLLAVSSAGATEVIDDRLRLRWYRIDVVVFERNDAADPGIARTGLLEAMRLPITAVPLTDEAPANNQPPFGQRLPVDDAIELVSSDLPPPAWFADCAVATWGSANRPFPFESCVAGSVDLEAVFLDDPHAWAAASPAEEDGLPEPSTLDEVAALRQALTDATKEFEQELVTTSYRWRRGTEAFAGALGRLRREFAVVAAGSWHQPLPPRDQPQPVLVQVGSPDRDRRFPLEGSFSVTLGRYVHFEARLQYRLPGGDTALLSERRRMREGESHYLDHPALGILTHASQVPPPAALQRLADQLRELENADR